jgi:hypothetical protein
MTLCLDNSTLSPLPCSKTQNVKKKGGTSMDFRSSLGFYEIDATFQGWVSSINSISDVCSCEKQRKTINDCEWKFTENFISLKVPYLQ